MCAVHDGTIPRPAPDVVACASAVHGYVQTARIDSTSIGTGTGTLVSAACVITARACHTSGVSLRPSRNLRFSKTQGFC